ncbi:unnamed protein product [Caenorhabditis bovis]|uniref:ADF-H domain-containing protein n=1 Tax=Caenorhabditis bovis TaxID=2654633 RepID=A0A8S1ERY7_9PELO|nr:unnamed protein product [Caenorhabditis bovis]
MTLDYNEHRREIEAAYKRATESSYGYKWVIFDYEGNSNTLKVGEQGTGGLSEFAESFSSGRLQFGVIVVRLSSDVLPKIVLVHWQGEGVQTLRLASARSHAEEFWRFLKTVHIVFHARSEIDIEPDAIRKEVSKLPSTNTNANVESSYSIPEVHESSSKPTKPHSEHNPNAKDEIWNKMNEEEKRRVAEEKSVNEMKQKQFEEDRKLIADDIHAKLQIQEKASSNGVDKTSSNTVLVSVLPSNSPTPVRMDFSASFPPAQVVNNIGASILIESKQWETVSEKPEDFSVVSRIVTMPAAPAREVPKHVYVPEQRLPNTARIPPPTSTFSPPNPSPSPPAPLSRGSQHDVVPKYTPEPEPFKTTRSSISEAPAYIRTEYHKQQIGGEIHSKAENYQPDCVTSVYKPVKPHVELNTSAREEFWNINEEENRVSEEKSGNEMKQKQFEEDRKRIADDIHAKLQIQEKASSNGVDKTPSNTVPVSVLPSHNSTPVYTAYEVPPVDTSTFSSPYPSSSPPDPLSYGFQYGVVPKYTPEPEPVKRARSNISRDEFRNKKNEEEKK